MLGKEYLDTARTILRAAQTMRDDHVAGQLKALAEDYERRAEKAAGQSLLATITSFCVRAPVALRLSARLCQDL